MNKITLFTNINCDSCRQKILKAFEGKNMITALEVDFANPEKPATFTVNDNVTPDDLISVIESVGYQAREAKKTGLFSKIFG